MGNKKIKQAVPRLLFLGEVVLFGWLYIVGPHGIQALWHVQYDNQRDAHEITQMRHAVDQLQQALYACQAQSFYKEKVAREQLQMAYEHDRIYRLPE